MPKRKNLNGLSHNLIKSFFGTERFFNCGYMADWLCNAARQLKINNATLDIISGTIDPTELNIYPLTINLKDLKLIIEKELKGNGFPIDFIAEAKIKLQFLPPKNDSQTISCFPILVDKHGQQFETGQIIECAYEDSFDAFDEKNSNPVFNKDLSTFNFESLKYTKRIIKESGA